MVTFNSTENTDTIYWDAVTETTPFTTLRSGSIRRTRRVSSWAPMNVGLSMRSNEANEDIKAGRIKCFNSVGDMLKSLNAR